VEQEVWKEGKMTPFSFEWLWNIEYAIFMGLLYVALLVVGCGLAVVWLKTWWDLGQDKEKGAGPPDLTYRNKYDTY
jgi:hypothetical protein